MTEHPGVFAVSAASQHHAVDFALRLFGFSPECAAIRSGKNSE
jgi:hypothetical protein